MIHTPVYTVRTIRRSASFSLHLPIPFAEISDERESNNSAGNRDRKEGKRERQREREREKERNGLEGDSNKPWRMMDQWKLVCVMVYRKNRTTNVRILSDEN